ncbi:MAG: hypothetical protein KBS96_06565 [Lachnospiraceae bacterium]|nr:hypothetical protein [Candidatus Colinaster scatohippi]
MNVYFDLIVSKKDGFSEEKFREIVKNKIEGCREFPAKLESIDYVNNVYKLAVRCDFSESGIVLLFGDLASIHMEYDFVDIIGIPQDKIVITDNRSCG